MQVWSLRLFLPHRLDLRFEDRSLGCIRVFAYRAFEYERNADDMKHLRIQGVLDVSRKPGESQLEQQGEKQEVRSKLSSRMASSTRFCKHKDAATIGAIRSVLICMNASIFCGAGPRNDSKGGKGSPCEMTTLTRLRFVAILMTSD